MDKLIEPVALAAKLAQRIEAYENCDLTTSPVSDYLHAVGELAVLHKDTILAALKAQEAPADVAETVAKLMRVDKPGYVRHTAANTFSSNTTYINPNGPEAADLIAHQSAQLAEARKVIEFYGERSNWGVYRVQNHGPRQQTSYTKATDDKGERARAWLAQQGDQS